MVRKTLLQSSGQCWFAIQSVTGNDEAFSSKCCSVLREEQTRTPIDQARFVTYAMEIYDTFPTRAVLLQCEYKTDRHTNSLIH